MVYKSFFAEILKSAFQIVIIWHRDKKRKTVQYDGVLHNYLDS